MTYVDGFVAAVPIENRDAYIRHAKIAAEIFKANGALQVVECWEDEVPDGKVTSFPMAVKRKEGEAVIFAWIVWPSREAEQQGMKAAMEDPRLQPGQNPMPFDGQRMIYGGFTTVLDV